MNMSIEYESIGKRIKKFRTERNLSQEKLAEMINTTNNHIKVQHDSSGVLQNHEKEGICL